MPATKFVFGGLSVALALSLAIAIASILVVSPEQAIILAYNSCACVTLVTTLLDCAIHKSPSEATAGAIAASMGIGLIM